MDLFTVTDCNSIIILLRDLGRDEAARKIWSAYIDTHREDPARLDIADSFQIQKMVEGFSEALLKGRRAASPLPTLSMALLRFGTDASDKRDEEVAVNASVDDLYELFTSTSGDELVDVVTGALFWQKVVNATSEQQAMTGRAEEALRRVGRTSRLNKLRVESMYRVRVEDHDESDVRQSE